MEISAEELVSIAATATDRSRNKSEKEAYPWVIGKPYLIRTVTMIQVGTLVWVGDKELILRDAAWIADTGRFSECLVNADVINEAEPFVNNVIIGRGSIVDATEWLPVKVSKK